LLSVAVSIALNAVTFAVYGDNDGRLSMKRPAFLPEATWWGRYPTPPEHRAAPVQHRVTRDFVVTIAIWLYVFRCA